jgi:hypothetical protein
MALSHHNVRESNFNSQYKSINHFNFNFGRFMIDFFASGFFFISTKAASYEKRFQSAPERWIGFHIVIFIVIRSSFFAHWTRISAFISATDFCETASRSEHVCENEILRKSFVHTWRKFEVTDPLRVSFLKTTPLMLMLIPLRYQGGGI